MIKNPERQTHAETLDTVELLELDLKEIKSRINAYKDRARVADRVVIIIICCDSRVVLPEELVTVQKPQGSEQVLFITVPTIGSGAPSRSRLRGIFQQITQEWQVDPRKVAFLVTQHGDSQEISDLHELEQDTSLISCGLRKFYLQEQKSLSHLRQLLVAWTYKYKAEQGDPTLAPDRMSLSELRTLVPGIMKEVDKIHERTGKAGFRIPRRLIIRAAYRNSHSDLELNEFSVFDKVAGYLQDPEYARYRADIFIGHASYDHQHKSLHLGNPQANLGWNDTLEFPDLPARSDRHQDPHYTLISFGSKTIPLAVRELLPHLCGVGSDRYRPPADNAFRTVASIPTVPTLLCGLAEAAYSVLHQVHPHEGDLNFRSLKKVIIICDDDTYVNVVKEMMADKEFQEEYLPMFKKLQPEGLQVVNLNLDDDSKKPELIVIPYND